MRNPSIEDTFDVHTDGESGAYSLQSIVSPAQNVSDVYGVCFSGAWLASAGLFITTAGKMLALRDLDMLNHRSTSVTVVIEFGLAIR